MDKTFLNWLLGFIEGEGCFHINITKLSDKKGALKQIYASFIFRIALAEKDKDVLYEICEKLKLGKVTFKSKKYFKGKANNQYLWTILKQRECENLCEILSVLKWRTSKHKDFLLWKKGFRMFYSASKKKIYGERIMTVDLLKKLCDIRDEMNTKNKSKQYKFFSDLIKNTRLTTLR